MRKLIVLVASAAVLLCTFLVATPAVSEDVQPPQLTIPPDPCLDHPYPAREQHKLAKTKAFALRKWRNQPYGKSPHPGPGNVRAMQQLRDCAEPHAIPAMRRSWNEARTKLKIHVMYRSVATEPGFTGEGYWLRWLVIPSWVVAAETSGYSGEGRWLATNPSSGACGPYQLLDHTSCDTSTWKDKLRHHQVAATLPRGSWAVGY